MGQRIGLIAGSGEFPALALAEARRRGYEVVVAAVKGEADGTLPPPGPDTAWFGPGELDAVLEFLVRKGTCEVLLAGKIRPESVLRPGPVDPSAALLLETAGSLSPARLLGAVIGRLEAGGLRVLDPTPFLGDAFVPAGVLTRTAPSTAALRDIERGVAAARTLADIDAGQTVVVRGGMVVALEGAEGTDRAIARGGALAGPGTAVVKVARTDQDPRVDLPGVGLATVRALVEAGAAALAVEAGRVAVFQREASVALADANGIAVVAVEIGPRRRS